MKITKSQYINVFFGIFILVMLIPQTRQPIQVLLHKGLALFSPSVVDKSNRATVNDFNWELIDEHGTRFNLQDANGSVVFVNFWATWCPPCIAEMPNLEELYEDYKDKVVFLLVSNEQQAVISSFKSKNRYDFPVYSSLTSHPREFDTSSIPRTYVIDSHGTIVIDKSGAANWNSKSVKTLLDSLLLSK